MKLIKKQISGLTYFSIDNLSISLDVSKRYNLNLWSEGTQKQGNYTKTLYFDDTLEEWRTRDCECSNKDKSLDFSIVIENNVLTSLETLKIYGIDNGGVHIFNEVYFELNEIGGGSSPTPTELPIVYHETYDASKIIEGYLTYFNSGANRGLWYRNENNQTKKLFTVGEYPDGYITNVNVNVGTNTLNIFREGTSTPLQYKPSLYTHTIILYNTQLQESMLFTMYLNTDSVPRVNVELITSTQLLSNFGVAAFHLFKSGNDDIIKSARFVFDGTNFVYWDDNTTTQVDWNPADCVVASDDIVDLLNVNATSNRTKKTINAFLKNKKE